MTTTAVTALEVADEDFLVASLIERCPKTMMVRELMMNALKDKRDYFVHRLFHEDAWPGDLGEDDCRQMTRRLTAIQLWLSRAERNVWAIFERAGFVEVDRLADGGLLVMNMGVCDLLETGDSDRNDPDI